VTPKRKVDSGARIPVAKSPSVQLPNRSGTRAATEECVNLSACRRQPARDDQAGTPPGSAERGARPESSQLAAPACASRASAGVRAGRRDGRVGGGSEQRLAPPPAQRLSALGGRRAQTRPRVRRQFYAEATTQSRRLCPVAPNDVSGVSRERSPQGLDSTDSRPP
jgi:hypothetical protein